MLVPTACVGMFFVVSAICHLRQSASLAEGIGGKSGVAFVERRYTDCIAGMSIHKRRMPRDGIKRLMEVLQRAYKCGRLGTTSPDIDFGALAALQSSAAQPTGYLYESKS